MLSGILIINHSFRPYLKLWCFNIESPHQHVHLCTLIMGEGDIIRKLMWWQPDFLEPIRKCMIGLSRCSGWRGPTFLFCKSPESIFPYSRMAALKHKKFYNYNSFNAWHFGLNFQQTVYWNIFLIFLRKQDLTFHANYNLHAMSNPIFWENYHQFVICWICPESGYPLEKRIILNLKQILFCWRGLLF